MQLVSMRDARNDFPTIINGVFKTGNKVIVTKHGEPMAVISRFTEADEKQRDKEYREILERTAGMWADRKEMKDPAKYVRNLRKPRYTI